MAPAHGPATFAGTSASLNARFASAAGAGQGDNKIVHESESMRESLGKMESGEIVDKTVICGPRIHSLWRPRGRELRGALYHKTAADAVRAMGSLPSMSTPVTMPSDAS